MITTRTAPSKSVEKDVLTASRRRCCLCVFLSDRHDQRRGQIAHLNRDPSDTRFENLVYLCLEHHDEYDSRPSQSKGFSPDEVREYRDRLYKKNGIVTEEYVAIEESRAPAIVPLPNISEYESVRRRFANELEFTLKRWRYPLWQVANEPELFAYKGGNRADGVCLLERVDLPDGRIAVICIETAGNCGVSITNCVEELCFQVCERFEVPAERLVWREHYDYLQPAEWNLVTFGSMPPDTPFRDPTWEEMIPEMWQSLLLKPKRKLVSHYGRFESKVVKLFNWPTAAIL